MKKVGYFLLAISLVLIISGAFSTYLIGLKKDRDEVLARMGDVSTEYEKFSTSVSLYGDYREDLHQSVFENLFLETMFSSDHLVKAELKKYEGMVDEIELNVNVLDDLCKNVYYPKSDVNNMCKSYRTMYEQVVNYFVADIKDYNENVEKYDQYQKSSNLNMVVQKYDTSKTYIDYDGDKKYAGKEE